IEDAAKIAEIIAGAEAATGTAQDDAADFVQVREREVDGLRQAFEAREVEGVQLVGAVQYQRQEPVLQLAQQCIAHVSSRLTSSPRHFAPTFRFEIRDPALVAQRQPDIVPAVDQALFPERIDLELDHAAVGSADFLRLQIDRDDGVGAAFGIVHQLVDLRLRQNDRKNAVLEAVVVEDVGEARRNHALDAEVEQRPRRMLAARAAAEIRAGDQDLRLLVRRLVEHEIGIPAAVGARAHLVEEGRTQTGTLDRLQELFRNDHVGVDIDHVERRGDAGKFLEGLHGGRTLEARTLRLKSHSPSTARYRENA